MNNWAPLYPVKSDGTLKLQRGNPFQYTWAPGVGRALPDGSSGSLVLQNSYGQTLATWSGTLSAGTLQFSQPSSDADPVPNGTAWTLMIDYNDSQGPRVKEQGTILRQEQPFPNAPALNPALQAVSYSYSFGTTGFVTDPAWRLMNGHPTVYDNSGRGYPNAVAAGSLVGGDLAVFDDVCMLYYAPLNTDAVRLTYTTVPFGEGDAWMIFCSNYDATNYAAIHHSRSLTGDQLSIATGTGPVSITDRQILSHGTTYENFTAEYDPSSNTFSVYKGTDTSPLVSWTDGASVVGHGMGNRYVGMGFKSAALTPGVEFAEWFIADDIGIG